MLIYMDQHTSMTMVPLCGFLLAIAVVSVKDNVAHKGENICYLQALLSWGLLASIVQNVGFSGIVI